jgi:hypothetical protein
MNRVTVICLFYCLQLRAEVVVGHKDDGYLKDLMEYQHQRDFGRQVAL